MLLQGSEFMQEGSFNDWKALEWERAIEHQGVVLAYQHLIALRKNEYGDSEPLAHSPITLIHVDKNNGVVAYRRGETFLIIVNFGAKSIEDYEIPLTSDEPWHKRFDSLWDGYDTSFSSVVPSVVSPKNNRISISLAAHQALIFSQSN
jgi:1,4-alpha-glucan branching enzyme